MSAKRVAGRQITDRDNGENESDEEEAGIGEFKRASDEVLATRKIIQSRKSSAAKASPSAAFSGFKGFGSPATNTASPQGTSTPPGFGFKAAAAAAAASNSADTKPAIGKPFGSSSSSSSSGLKFGTTMTKAAAVNGTAGGAGQKTMAQSFADLNTSFAKWVSDSLIATKELDLSPGLQSYIGLAARLVSAAGVASGSSDIKTPSGLFAMSSSPSGGTAASAAAKPPAHGFTFNTKPAPTSAAARPPAAAAATSDKPTPGFGFKASTDKPAAATPSFGFGIKPAAAKPAEDKPGSSITPAPQFGQSKPPSVGSAGVQFKPPVFSKPAEKKDEDEEKVENEEEEEEEDTTEVKIPDEETNSLYSVRAKLFYKRGADWVERGLGLLSLQEDGSKAKLVIRDETKQRNYLLNVYLYSGLKVGVQEGKSGSVFVSFIANPPVDPSCAVCKKKHPNPKTSNHCVNGCFGAEGSTHEKHMGEKPSMTMYLIRVKSPEIANELKKKIEEKIPA